MKGVGAAEGMGVGNPSRGLQNSLHKRLGNKRIKTFDSSEGEDKRI